MRGTRAELIFTLVVLPLGLAEDRSWKGLPSLLTARTVCTVTVLGGDVVVLGG